MAYTSEYDDIINRSHYQSKVYRQMNNHDRAAQFSPFAALTGYEDAIAETSRLTCNRRELDEEYINILDKKINLIIEHIQEKPQAAITYFVPDEKKPGGSYLTAVGNVRRVDIFTGYLMFTDGRKFPLKDIYDFYGDFFDE